MSNHNPHRPRPMRHQNRKGFDQHGDEEAIFARPAPRDFRTRAQRRHDDEQAETELYRDMTVEMAQTA